jgi:hypothetical protein
MFPAIPSEQSQQARSNGRLPAYPTGRHDILTPGYTKREEFAMSFLGGLIAMGRHEPKAFLAREAVEHADALLLALEESQ